MVAKACNKRRLENNFAAKLILPKFPYLKVYQKQNRKNQFGSINAKFHDGGHGPVLKENVKLKP